MNNEELKQLIDQLTASEKELEWIEFKKDNSRSDLIGEYISALSNSACLHQKQFGYLVYGVNNDSHEIIGSKFNPKTSKTKGQELENYIATQLNPRIDFEIFQCDYDGVNVPIFRIQSANDKPVKYKGEAYIRIGSYTKKLKDHPEKERKIWNRSIDNKFENKLCKENIKLDEVLSLIDYPSYFELIGKPLPTSHEGIIIELETENLIRKTRNSYAITNLGAILFAKNLSNFETLSRKRIRVIEYKGNSKIETKREQEGQKGYAVGFVGLVDYIMGLLPINEEIDRALRKEVTMYPEIAIRELVANALIHQDFNSSGTGPMVEIYSDRVEISNPGNSLIDPLRLIDHNPKSRNEKLANLMRRIKICEERGSGIDKVVYHSEVFQLPAPEFIEEENFMKTVLYAPKSLNEMTKLDKIRACYQHCVLRYVSNSQMTNETLRERFSVKQKNYSVVSRIIKETQEKGLIKDFDPSNKSNRYARYIPFWA